MKQAYLKLTAVSNKDDSKVPVFIRHDIIGSMHEEDGYTLIMYAYNGGVKVTESLADILRMLESLVVNLQSNGTIEVDINKH